MINTFAWESAIVALAIGIGVAAYFDDRPTYSDLETTVLQEPFLDGQSLLYRWNGKVLRNCKGAMRREIRQGGEIFHLPDRNFTWIPSEEWVLGERQNFIVGVGLGDFRGRLGAGPATYHVTQVSHCNRIQSWFGRTIEEEYPPVSFEIWDRP